MFFQILGVRALHSNIVGTNWGYTSILSSTFRKILLLWTMNCKLQEESEMAFPTTGFTMTLIINDLWEDRFYRHVPIHWSEELIFCSLTIYHTIFIGFLESNYPWYGNNIHGVYGRNADAQNAKYSWTAITIQCMKSSKNTNDLKRKYVKFST